jgi:NitT/TauT family transport system substrate-binding protein
MHQFKLVATLCAVIVSAVIQFETASAQTKITIGYAAVSPRTTPLYLAQEQGLFAKYGLDPKIVLVRAAATLVATLVSGEMDVGYTGGTSVLGAAGQGSYLKILSSISSTLTHTLVAHPSIKRAEELRGKRFGFRIPAARPGSTQSWRWNLSGWSPSGIISICCRSAIQC